MTASFVYYENDCINSAYACSSKFYASMIAGTPVICNDLPVFRRFSEEHGACWILESLDPSAIALCVDRLTATDYSAIKKQSIEAGAALREFPRATILKQAVQDVLGPRRTPVERVPENSPL